MYGGYYGGYMAQQSQPMPDQLAQLRQAQPQPQSGIVWVQGEAAAKSYAVPFGASVPLFDTEGDVFYIKSVDSSGMPLPLRMFKYTEVLPQGVPVSSEGAKEYDMSKFLTREQLIEILTEMGVVAKEKGGVKDGKQTV